MKLIFIAAYIAACSAAKLDRAYLPPASAKTAGGSPGSLQTPFAGNSFNQGLGGLPKGSYTNDFQGVVVDAASAGTRASGPGESGLGLPRTVYGSADSKVGEAAFRSTPVAGFRQLPGSGQTHSSSHNDQGPERPQAAQERASNTLRFNSEVGPESFNYAFETDNGIIAEENGVENNGVQAQGAYAYKGDDGQVYSVTYTADEGGYQPKGDHLPTPPPIPEEILRSLEQNAKEEAAGIVDDGSYDAQKYNAGGDYAENDNSGQYNGKVEQSGNRHSDATTSGSFISQSNVGRPNSFAASAAHSGFHDKSASAGASVNDGNKSIKDYLPPNQQKRPEQSSTGFINGGSTNGNFQPLSSTNKHRSQSSAFASSQPSIGSQISGFGHQQLTNVKPNQPSQTRFEGEDHSSLSSNIAPSTPFGSSQSDLNSHGSVSNNGPQFHSQFQSLSNQRNFESTNGRPQFNINAQNQRESTRAQSASSLASLDSQAHDTPQLTNSSPRFNGNNRAHGTQAPTQSASSFASFNSQASSPGHISSTRFHSQPTNGSPQFNGNSRGQDVPVPTQSASSFASFNSQPSHPSQTSFQSQLTNGSPQINGNNRGQSGQAPTQSSFASFKSEAFPGQLPSGSAKNNIHGSQFSRQDQNKQFGTISEIQNKIPESAQSAFTGLNSQPGTSSAHGETSKFPGSSFNSQNFDSSTQYGTQGSSNNHNVGTKKPTDDGNLQPQFDNQSQSSVENKPGQHSSFSSVPFNSQIPSSPNSNLQFGFNQKSTGPFNQLQGQNHDDTRFSPSTSRPDFSQSQGQDDSYYYNQPSQSFKTPSVHGSPLSASSNAQFSNTVHGSQIQGYSKQPSSVRLTSPTQIAGQNQNNYNGITQATASSFTSSLPTTATNFNVQPSNQFGMKTTSSQINRRPQPIQSGTFGSQTTKSQNTPENVNHNIQTNSFQSKSSNVPSGNKNSGDSSFGQSTSQQYSGEIYEYNKPAQTLPAPSNSDLSSGQFGQKDQSSKSISQSAIQPQVANKFDTQEAASDLTSFGQPVSGSAFGKQGNNVQPIQTQFNIQSTNQGTRGSKPFGVQIPQDPCCQGSRASAQASFGSKPIQSSGNSQFNNAGRPSQDSGQQAHLSAQNLGGSPQSFKTGQFPNQKQGTGQFGSQSATAQSFQSGQSVAGKGEVFGGPRKPPSFDAESGYHY